MSKVELSNEVRRPVITLQRNHITEQLKKGDYYYIGKLYIENALYFERRGFVSKQIEKELYFERIGFISTEIMSDEDIVVYEFFRKTA